MPLTQDQKDQLHRIFDETTVPDKLKNLLKHAIVGWESTTPTTGSYGVHVRENKVCSLKDKTCLLGSAVLNKQIFIGSINECLSSYFSLCDIEQTSLAWGFDGCEYDSNAFNEYYEFGKRIREIVIT